MRVLEKQLWLESDRDRTIGQRRHPGGDRRSGYALQVAQSVRTHRTRLGQLEQGNAARGHAGEVEAVPRWGMEAVTLPRAMSSAAASAVIPAPVVAAAWTANWKEAGGMTPGSSAIAVPVVT
jgi:hypothetical protein